MMTKDEKESLDLTLVFDVITDKDGKEHYALNKESAEIVGEFVQTQKWWRETRRRVKKVGIIWTAILGVFGGLALIWPAVAPAVTWIAQKIVDGQGGH